MLIFLALTGCSNEAAPPRADGPKREHHVARTDRGGEAATEDDVAAGPPDGTFGGGNRSPIVRRMTISPTKPNKLSTMKVNVNATDPEGQPLTYSYHWRVNGNEVLGHDAPDLPLADFSRDDTVQVSVEVSDGAAAAHGESELFTIGNADPQIEKVPGPKDTFDGLRLSAEDPDGDDVRWRVEGGPPGASIDGQGYLHYVGSESDKGGSYTVKVYAEDGKGGKGTLELPLTVNAGSKGVPPPAGVPTGGR